jgi:hypothetical protein
MPEFLHSQPIKSQINGLINQSNQMTNNQPKSDVLLPPHSTQIN